MRGKLNKVIQFDLARSSHSIDWDHPAHQTGDTIMLGLAKVVAIVGALLAPPVAYLAYSAADNGNHYGDIKNGNTGIDRNVHGAPGPLAGAGALGLLAAGGLVWFMRRRRRDI